MASNQKKSTIPLLSQNEFYTNMPESESNKPEIATAETIITTWLTAITDTASQHDHTAHMNLISKNIRLTGVPGFESIGFDDWSSQCKDEFEKKLIVEIKYQGLKVRAATDSRIMFVTEETVIASDGTKNQQGIECLLDIEDDGTWRLRQQRVLADDETAQYLKEDYLPDFAV